MYGFKISDLEFNDQQKVITRLDDKFKKKFLEHRPSRIALHEVRNSENGELVSVSGVPKFVESKEEFNGFIMIPNMAGSVTFFTMIPIVEMYDVYELREEKTEDVFFVAHAKSKEKLPPNKINLGGVIKELRKKKDEEDASSRFLEILYYQEV